MATIRASRPAKRASREPAVVKAGGGAADRMDLGASDRTLYTGK
jgi:hypothetical protein